MTPSGFRHGIILNTNLFLNSLETGFFDNRKSMIPFMINDAFTSPGWTRADRITMGLSLIVFALELKLVMVNRSILFPSLDRHNNCRRKMLALLVMGDIETTFKYPCKSV